MDDLTKLSDESLIEENLRLGVEQDAIRERRKAINAERQRRAHARGQFSHIEREAAGEG